MQYKFYREDNYIMVVNSTNQEMYTGFVKEVFVKKSNASQPSYTFFNIKDLPENTIIRIGNILKEDGTPYTQIEFEEFYTNNTGNFNGGGSAPGVQSITGTGVDNTDPENPIINATEEAPIDGNIYGRQDGGWTVINEIDIPEDFFIATQIASSKLIYETDSFREIDLQPYTSIIITNTNEIVRNGNDIFAVGNYSDTNTLQAFLIRIINCRIKDNELIFDIIDSIPLSQPIHGLIFHNGFLYSATRTTVTTITKINPYNLSDIRILILPETSDYVGFTDGLIGYKDKLYILTTSNYYQTSKFIEINEDLIRYRKVFEITNSVNYSTGYASPFLIYNDELYIPFLIQGNPSLISFRVYDLQGTIKRERTNIAINQTGGTNSAVPHWMTIFNNKILITTIFAKSLIRLDCQTLSLEESISLPSIITDDNSITKEGYIYLNGELYQSNPSFIPHLIKVYYKDFTDYNIVIDTYNNGNGSYGSINAKVNTSALNPNLIYKQGATNNLVIGEPGVASTLTAPNLTNALINTGGAKSLTTQEYVALRALIASPTFTGIPAAPTASFGTNTTQLATTAFVTQAGNFEVTVSTGATSTITAGRKSQMITYKTLLEHTATLPDSTLTTNSGSILFIINKMSGDLILNSSDGTAKIWDGGSLVNSITIASNTSERLICTDQTYIRL